MPQGKLYVHCGTCKTGTTALQAALRSSGEALLAAGYLYPFAGTLNTPGQPITDLTSAAHRNIAWQLMRSRAYAHELGDIDALEAEIGAFSGNVILSCEDFESILHKPRLFRPLFDLANKTSREIVLVLYLRNQISYFESLYSELLKHGTGEEYISLSNTAISAGLISARDCVYHFDYARLLEPWRTAPRLTMIVRNFHDLRGGSTVSDFGTLIGADDILQPFPGAAQTNVRQELGRSLRLFYENRTGRSPSYEEILRIRHLSLARERLRTSGPLREKFISRFTAGNLAVCRDWSLNPIGLDMEESATEGVDLTLEQFFSFETHFAIRTGAVPLPKFSAMAGDAAAWMKGIELVEQSVTRSSRARFQYEKIRRYVRWYASKMPVTINIRLSRFPLLGSERAKG